MVLEWELRVAESSTSSSRGSRWS
ncbi:rCG46840 [Rattus norvegicus]|uniref:RCG46840 n=1 Tax=Rattus norvegicus TaxID=10116 RepID=A6IXG2_RAT|nr:rCG46840 [Rattus norvegicus]